MARITHKSRMGELFSIGTGLSRRRALAFCSNENAQLSLSAFRHWNDVPRVRPEEMIKLALIQKLRLPRRFIDAFTQIFSRRFVRHARHRGS